MCRKRFASRPRGKQIQCACSVYIVQMYLHVHTCVHEQSIEKNGKEKKYASTAHVYTMYMYTKIHTEITQQPQRD